MVRKSNGFTVKFAQKVFEMSPSRENLFFSPFRHHHHHLHYNFYQINTLALCTMGYDMAGSKIFLK